jgi:hypothetical protein
VTNRTEVRAGVGIERKSQAASTGVLYDTEVVVGGGFETRLSGENYSLWQLGLVLAALQDLDAGLVRIGGCKARGMGTVKVKDLSVELAFLDREEGRLTGARRMDGPDYGLSVNDVLAAPEPTKTSRKGLFRILCYEGKEAVEDLATSLIDGPLQRYLGGR